MAFLDQLANLQGISFPEVIELAARCIPPGSVASAKSRVSGGIRLLNRESELNDYLVAFGEIHRAKLWEFLPQIPFGEFQEEGLVLVDWGCGQGLATSVTLDYLRQKSLNVPIRGVRMIELVEPALRRAEALARRYLVATDAEVRTFPWNEMGVQSVLEGLPPGVPVLHLFSNIIDVRAIDFRPVIAAMERLRAGRRTYVLSVGPDRETTTSQPERVRAFYEQFSGKRLLHAFPSGGSGRLYADWKYWPYPYCKCYGIAYSLAPTAVPQPVPVEVPVPVQPQPVDPPPPPLPPPDPEDVLMYASADMADELSAVLRAGAPVDAANEKGATALYLAAKHGCLDSVRVLVKAGADLERSVFTTGLTPFLIAVKYERLEVAEFLKTSGCDVLARDRKGRSAADIARLYELSPKTLSFANSTQRN